MSKRKEKPRNLTVIVSGKPVEMAVVPSAPLSHVAWRGFHESGSASVGVDWELRAADGTLYDLRRTVAECEVPDGALLYLSPMAGAGGVR